MYAVYSWGFFFLCMRVVWKTLTAPGMVLSDGKIVLLQKTVVPGQMQSSPPIQVSRVMSKVRHPPGDFFCTCFLYLQVKCRLSH